MPAVITHYIFALRVRALLEKDGCRVRESAPFLIGAQGPDIFFFHRVLPWEPGKSYARQGVALHKSSPARLFSFFRESIQQEQRQRDWMLSYVQGFFCHYALDRTAHPFVYARQEQLRREQPGYGGRTNHYHYRIESALDTLALRRELGQPIEAFSLPDVLPAYGDGHRALGRLYRPVFTRLLGLSGASEASLSLAAKDMRHALWWMADRHLLMRRCLLHPVEAVAGHGAFASSLLRPRETDDWDYENRRHRLWTYPADETVVSTADFWQLFDRAAQEAVAMIKGFTASLQGAGPTMDALTGDRGFNTDWPGRYW